MDNLLSVNAVCNQIIRKAVSTNTSITPLKLQKLLYLVYAYSLKYNNGKKLFDAQFSAWQYGPVCIPVYEEFSCFGGSNITCYAKNAYGKSAFPNPDFNGNKIFFKAFNDVWSKYANLKSSELVNITHGSKRSAWHKTKTNQIILDKDIILDIENGEY